MVVINSSYEGLDKWGQPVTTYEVVGKYNGHVVTLAFDSRFLPPLQLQPGTILKIQIVKVVEYVDNELVKAWMQIDLPGDPELWITDFLTPFNELKIEILKGLTNGDSNDLYYAALKIDGLEENDLNLLIEISQRKDLVSDLVLKGLRFPIDNTGDSVTKYSFTEIGPPVFSNQAQPASLINVSDDALAREVQRSPLCKVYGPKDTIDFWKNASETLGDIYQFDPFYLEILIRKRNHFVLDIDAFADLPKPTIVTAKKLKTDFDKRLQDQSRRRMTIRDIKGLVQQGVKLVEIDYSFPVELIELNKNKMKPESEYINGFSDDYFENIRWDDGCARCQELPCRCSDPDPG